MRILITGADGYEGWPMALYCRSKGHDVLGLDNGLRRQMVSEVGGDSILPIASESRRRTLAKELGFTMATCDIQDYCLLADHVETFRPDVVIHMAEQPSAPYSMMDDGLCATLENNTVGTANLLMVLRDEAPKAHLVYVSTMGVYGTPGIPIPEGVCAPGTDYGGLMFPPSPGSVYHVSKVASSILVDRACKWWGMRATTLYQGVVCGVTHALWSGTQPDETDLPYRTRLDVDEAFGTVVNRFCAQAVLGVPLTVYGKGNQQRGHMTLHDAVRSTLACAEVVPEEGQHRHANQIAELYSVSALAKVVKEQGATLGLSVKIDNVFNPRVEAEDHSYEVATDNFRAAYPYPFADLQKEIRFTLGVMVDHRENLKEVAHTIPPSTVWR